MTFSSGAFTFLSFVVFFPPQAARCSQKKTKPCSFNILLLHTVCTVKTNGTGSPLLKRQNIKTVQTQQKKVVQCCCLKIQCLVSVSIDPENPHSVEERQLGQEDAQQGAGVDDEMCGVVFCVETGEDVPAQTHREKKDPYEGFTSKT